jgi:hypothetical protein
LSGGNQLQTWKVQTSPSPTLVKDSWSQNILNGQDGGFFTTVSSSGNTHGIIWAVGRPDGSNNNAVYLDAFCASRALPVSAALPIACETWRSSRKTCGRSSRSACQAAYQAPCRAIARDLAAGVIADYGRKHDSAVTCFMENFEACIVNATR